ncbi:MAG: hypothetical protein AABX78_01360, partial [Nanoarchaeota archaeon]
FIRSIFTNPYEDMFKKLNRPITQNLWNKRGDYQLYIGDLDNAFEAYQKADNLKGVELVKQRALNK